MDDLVAHVVRRHLMQAAESAAPAPPPPRPIGPFPSLTGGQAILYGLVVTAIILVALFLTIRALFIRATGRMPMPAHLAAQTAAGEIPGQPAGAVGLHPALVATFPTFAYDVRAMGSEEGDAGCVVCLEDYKAGDVLRGLPDCRHAFHATCIDAWFKQHTTCPICRVSLQPKAPDVENPPTTASPQGQPAPVTSGLAQIPPDNWVLVPAVGTPASQVTASQQADSSLDGREPPQGLSGSRRDPPLRVGSGGEGRHEGNVETVVIVTEPHR